MLLTSWASHFIDKQLHPAVLALVLVGVPSALHLVRPCSIFESSQFLTPYLVVLGLYCGWRCSLSPLCTSTKHVLYTVGSVVLEAFCAFVTFLCAYYTKVSSIAGRDFSLSTLLFVLACTLPDVTSASYSENINCTVKDRRVSFSLQSIRILILSSAFHPFTFHSSRFFFDLLIASPLYTLLSCILGILFVLLFCCLLKYGVLNQSYCLELPALFTLFALLCTVLRHYHLNLFAFAFTVGFSLLYYASSLFSEPSRQWLAAALPTLFPWTETLGTILLATQLRISLHGFFLVLAA
ncbi:hypothetical protein WA577_006632, partial [Blastocystis sp. JDR]